MLCQWISAILLEQRSGETWGIVASFQALEGHGLIPDRFFCFLTPELEPFWSVRSKSCLLQPLCSPPQHPSPISVSLPAQSQFPFLRFLGPASPSPLRFAVSIPILPNTCSFSGCSHLLPVSLPTNLSSPLLPFWLLICSIFPFYPHYSFSVLVSIHGHFIQSHAPITRSPGTTEMSHRA